MNKIFYILLVIGLMSSCNDDGTKEKKGDLSLNTAKSASSKEEVKEKRVLKAKVVVNEDLEAKKEEIKKDRELELEKKKREALYDKNKKIRDQYKKNGIEPSDENLNAEGLVDMGNGVKIGRNYDFAIHDLPSTCDLLSTTWLEKEFKINADDILVKDASSPKTRYAKACFFKWDQEGVANSGIMLQIQRNPVPDLTESWVTEYITSKKKEGESDMQNPDVRMTYKDLPGLGDEAVYNYSLNRCYWRLGEKDLFMLAFNLGLEEDAERKAAVSIGNEVLRNYKKIKNKK